MGESQFSFQVRVYFEDTDAGGIVYYANYLKFCERCRTEWVRKLGFCQQEMLKRGTGFVVVDLQGRYHKSARLDDLLTVTCTPVLVRAAKLKLAQTVLNAGGELLFDFACTLAYVDFSSGRPMVLPQELTSYARAQEVTAPLSSAKEH